VSTTTSQQGSAYQQLRGHLHYLRLEAAAEALPAAHARQAKLSHTAFLEHLLGIEVHATQTAASKAACALPPSPPPGDWKTSTSTPNPPWTAPWSTNWPPCGSSTSTPTCC
jgi:hypothetical protein